MTNSECSKTCISCGETFPAEPKFFRRAGKTLIGRCKICTASDKMRPMIEAKLRTPEGMKLCHSCGNTRPATAEYFYRNKNAKSGLHVECKECANVRKRGWYDGLTDAQRDLRKLYDRGQRRRMLPQRRKREREYARAYREKNRDTLRVHQSSYVRNRRARDKGAEGTHSGYDIIAIYERQEGRCFYCQVELYGEYHVDHLTPFSRGGTNYPENLCCACKSCNASKHDKTQAEFEQFLREEGD